MVEARIQSKKQRIIDHAEKHRKRNKMKFYNHSKGKYDVAKDRFDVRDGENCG